MSWTRWTPPSTPRGFGLVIALAGSLPRRPMLVVAAWLASLALLVVYNLLLSYFVAGTWAVVLAALVTGIVALNLFAFDAYHHAGSA